MSSEYVSASECNNRSGIVVERILIMNEEKVINEAAEKVYECIKTVIRDVIEIRGHKLKAFYIGRSFIDKNPEVSSFNILYGHTWDLEAGVKACYQAHKGKEHCRNSLIMVAAATNRCIPLGCSGIGSGCFSNLHEYTLTLETRLRQKILLANSTLSGKLKSPGADSSSKSTGPHEASVIYMTFTTERKILYRSPAPEMRPPL